MTAKARATVQSSFATIADSFINKVADLNVSFYFKTLAAGTATMLAVSIPQIGDIKETVSSAQTARQAAMAQAMGEEQGAQPADRSPPAHKRSSGPSM